MGNDAKYAGLAALILEIAKRKARELEGDGKVPSAGQSEDEGVQETEESMGNPSDKRVAKMTDN